jgi:vancomycin permeability regulator SanA
MSADAGLPRPQDAVDPAAPAPSPLPPRPPLAGGPPPGPGWTQVPPPKLEGGDERRRSWPVAAVARGFALFFGCFTLVNVFGLARRGADFNVWWVAVPGVGTAGTVALYVLAGAALAGYAAAPRMRPWRRWPTVGLALGLAVATAWNGVDFYRSWHAGEIRPGVPVPLSFVLCAVLVFVGWSALRPPAPRRRRWAAAAVLVSTAAACVLLFPVAQVFFFGQTDYRRPADVAVVFGAQVHENGKASTSLRDRMTTAVQLYKDGLVKRLIVSGGVGDSGYNEAIVMRDLAVKAGVPASDVAVDSNGVSTNATVADTVPFFGGEGWRRILAVSQFYHLPRIKLAYQRAGWNVLTVPAPAHERTGFMVVREIPAFWVYYLRAVGG